ncbi:MAG: hypothetical protein JW965_00380 [Bacteroidales bacterium]|nr:hypothetical protein [Bacteroidales bacterium]
MKTLLFYQSGDLSDAITEVTEALGHTLTFILIVIFIIYLILRGIAKRSNKKDK